MAAGERRSVITLVPTPSRRVWRSHHPASRRPTALQRRPPWTVRQSACPVSPPAHTRRPHCPRQVAEGSTARRRASRPHLAVLCGRPSHLGGEPPPPGGAGETTGIWGVWSGAPSGLCRAAHPSSASRFPPVFQGGGVVSSADQPWAGCCGVIIVAALRRRGQARPAVGCCPLLSSALQTSPFRSGRIYGGPTNQRGMARNRVQPDELDSLGAVAGTRSYSSLRSSASCPEPLKTAVASLTTGWAATRMARWRGR